MAASTDVKRRGRYVRAPHPSTTYRLTPRQWRLLRWLSSYRILTAEQFALLSGRTPHTVRQQLRGLFDAGLIDVIPVNRSALAGPEEPDDASLLYGSAPNVYVPTKRGLVLLLDHDLIEEVECHRPGYSFGPRSSIALAHTLLIRDVRIWLERSSAFHKGALRLAQWRDGGEATMTLSETKRLGPDAWFVFNMTAGDTPAVLVGLVECDRGTERGMARWGEKLANYQSLFHGDMLRRATGYERARVLVVTLSASRRDRLAEMIQEHDQSRSHLGALANRFWLVEKTALEREDLALAKWRRPSVKELQPLIGRDLAPLPIG